MASYSIVVPVYNEQDVIEEFYRRTAAVCSGLEGSCELIFVNDGSTDDSRTILRKLQAQDPRVKIVNLSRNFGHQRAITSGIDHAKGDAVIIIDADLQDPPEVIPKLVEKWREGYLVVYAQRTARKGEKFLKKATAHAFYRVMRRIAPHDAIPEDTGDFRLIDRRVVHALKHIRESHRFMRGLISWVGFPQASVAFVRDARYAGHTKYPFKKSLLLALDAITSFSIVPLRLAIYVGFVTVLVTFLLAIYALVSHFVLKSTIQGWTSVIIVLLFVGGVQLVVIGVLGEYMGRIYEEVKRRPLYIVESASGFDDAENRQTAVYDR